jgi:hypothetical protein
MKITAERALAEARKYDISHGGKFMSPIIYRAADVLADRVEELEQELRTTD